MDGNKDESLRCVRIAEAAIASGDKQRALKFINFARRLNSEAPVDDLFLACHSLDSEDSKSKPVVAGDANLKHSRDPSKPCRSAAESSYSEEHVSLIRQVNRNKDYYAILGVDNTCSVEEIRKAYKKLSLKVHPDKNKAPGSEEAFKKVCQAFKCLSQEQSRRQYDQTQDFEYNHHNNNSVRRRRATDGFFYDDFDPNEIFRSFFDQRDDAFSAHVDRARAMAARERSQQTEANHADFSMMILVQLLAILIMFLLAVVPFSVPEFSLQKNHAYQFQYFTEKYGVDFYVKSSEFDQKHPTGSPSRANIEAQVVKEYKSILRRNCHAELQRRQWYRNYPTPHCDKLQNLGIT